MYIVFLKFGPNRSQAPRWMNEHKQWIQSGIDDGVFLMAGSLDEARGGAVLAVNTTRPALMTRVRQDPFVAHGVVTAEVLGITPSRVAPGLSEFLHSPCAPGAAT